MSSFIKKIVSALFNKKSQVTGLTVDSRFWNVKETVYFFGLFPVYSKIVKEVAKEEEFKLF